MADLSIRSSSGRSTPRLPLKPRHKPSPNLPPSRDSARVTRSRSREIREAGTKGAVSRKESIKTPGGAGNLAHKTAQATGFSKRSAISKASKDLPTVTEDVDVVNMHSPPDKVVEVDPKGYDDRNGLEQAPQQTKSPGTCSAISGTTARNSYSDQDLAHSNSKRDLRRRLMKKTVGAYRQLRSGATGDSAAESFNDAPSASPGIANGHAQLKGSAPMYAGSRLSQVPFNSPKYLRYSVAHLKQLKAEASKAPQSPKARQVLDGVNTANATKMTEEKELETGPYGGAQEMDSQDPGHGSARRVLGLHQEGDEIWQHPGFEEVDDDDVLVASKKKIALDPTARGRQVLELQARRDAENNKENIGRYEDQPAGRRKKRYFTDPQPNAERIPFESPEPTQSVLRDQEQPQLPQGANMEEEATLEPTEETSSDEGFEQDERQINVRKRPVPSSSRKHVAPAPTTNNRRAKRVRVVSSDDSLSEETRTAVARHNQEQIPAPSQLENYKIANMQAKIVTSVQPKKPQIRKAWTDEETEKLIELIEELGTSWKLLKDRDRRDKSILSSRDQVALKDKARNIKFDFLKAGNHMPQNFEHVSLSKFQIEKLRSLGIDYDATRNRDED